jgi:hypothetical protein
MGEIYWDDKQERPLGFYWVFVKFLKEETVGEYAIVAGEDCCAWLLPGDDVWRKSEELIVLSGVPKVRQTVNLRADTDLVISDDKFEELCEFYSVHEDSFGPNRVLYLTLDRAKKMEVK